MKSGKIKKLLIIGAGIEQVPAIKIAQEMGIFVIATDMSPTAPGMEIADKNYVVSTKDEKGNVKIAKKENINGVMTLCSETAIPVVAGVAIELGLSGISKFTALAATNKGVMRDAMCQYGVQISEYQIVSNKEDALSFVKKHPSPWVIKPSDSSGQRGTTFISDTDEISEAFDFAKKYSSDGKVLIDQYVEGHEINVTALVHKGNIKLLSLSNRVTLLSPNFGIAVRHIAPVSITEKEQEAVSRMAVDSIRAIGLENGIAYPQIIINKNGPHLIEIAARIPGGHMREVGMYLSGIDMIKSTIWQALGYEFSFQEAITEKTYKAISIKFITSVNINENINVVKSINGIDEVKKMKGIKECYINLCIGEKILKLVSSVGRFGAIIAVGDSRQEALARVDNVFNNITINNKNFEDYNNYNMFNGK